MVDRPFVVGVHPRPRRLGLLAHVERQAVQQPFRLLGIAAGQAGLCSQTWGTGMGAGLGKLFSLVYHYASQSLFAYAGNDDQCVSPTTPLVWRIQ